MEHIWHKCDEENCFVCNNGLSACTVCGQAEGILEKYCPGPKKQERTSMKIFGGYITGRKVSAEKTETYTLPIVW